MGAAPGKVTVSFRFPSELREQLAARAAEREESMTDVARALLEAGLGSREPSVADGVPSGAAAAPLVQGAREVSGTGGDPMPVGAESGSGVSQVGGERPVDFAGWLSQRTGLPAAICRFKISRGLVRVDGDPHLGALIDAGALEGQVTFDGRVL